MHQSPIAPFIFIDVEAAERACRLEREAFAAQWRKLKEEEETLISICVSSKCPLLSKRKQNGEWCLSGDAHLKPDRVYNSMLKRSVTIRCPYAELISRNTLPITGNIS